LIEDHGGKEGQRGSTIRVALQTARVVRDNALIWRPGGMAV